MTLSIVKSLSLKRNVPCRSRFFFDLYFISIWWSSFRSFNLRDHQFFHLLSKIKQK